MTARVRLTPEAEADITEAYDWYEEARPGLGDRFLDAVSEGFDYVAEWPEASPGVHGAVRRALLHRFPYGLIYVVEGEEVVVLGCFHARRDPTVWELRAKRYRSSREDR